MKNYQLKSIISKRTNNYDFNFIELLSLIVFLDKAYQKQLDFLKQNSYQILKENCKSNQ